MNFLPYISFAVFCFFATLLESQALDRDEVTVEVVAVDLKSGHPRLAAKHAKLILDTDSKSSIAHALSGLALIDCGEYEKSEDELRVALSLDEGTPEAHLGMGKLLYAEGKRNKAIDHLHKATSSTLLKYMAHELLGTYLSRLVRHEEAAKVYTRALKEISDLTDFEKNFLTSNISIFKGYGKRKLYRIPENFRSTTVSFANSEGHILTPIKANGVDIGRVHLDTGGSGGLTISAEWAKKLNLKIIGQRTGRNVAKELKADVAVLDEVQFGDLVIKNVPVNLFEGSAFHGNSSGNLGKEVLQQMNMTLDFKNSELTIFHPNHPDLQASTIDQKNACNPIPFHNINFIIIKASINGHDARPFILDTGAGAVVFHEDYYFETLQPPVSNDNEPKLDAPKPFQVQTILIGNRTYKEQLSIAMDLGDLYSFAGVYYPGIIGNPLFQNSKLHFNFLKSQLTVEEVP